MSLHFFAQRRAFTALVLSCCLLLLLSGCVTTWHASSKIEAPQPITSPYDPHSYRYLEFESGLQVLLVSDPQAEKAAASMNVNAGSLHEPDAWPGLAHFLEHMLFLGTADFPEPDGYQQLISEQGGSYNAFTASRDTNYFFDIQPAAFDAALARFSRFFVDPLLNEDYLQREVNAVDAEWSGTLQSDGRRFFDVLRTALNPEHPASRFSAGNRATLDIDNPALREALLDYHQRFYVAELMSLALVGPHSLDELETLARQHFSDLRQAEQDHTPVRFTQPLLVDQQLPMQLQMEPLRRDYQLSLIFSIPDPQLHQKVQADRFLAYLIHHEGENSLFDYLRREGWITALSAGSGFNTGEEALFFIDFTLTAEGAQQAETITAWVFHWLEMIQQQGIEAWRYQELAQITEQSFLFQESNDPSDFATFLALQMAYTSPEQLLRQPYAFDHFDVEVIERTLQHLQPERLVSILVTPDAQTSATTDWVPARYHRETNLPAIEWRQVPRPEALQLPEPNPFITDQHKLVEGESLAVPVRLDHPSRIEVWHGQDTSFGLPQGDIYINLIQPQVLDNREARLLAGLTASWLEDRLNNPTYPARLAGLHYSIDSHARGITIQVSGLTAKQPELLEQLLSALDQPQVHPNDFRLLRDRWIQQLENRQHDRPIQQLVRQLYLSMIDPTWPTSELLEVLDGLAYTDLQDFIDHYTDQLAIQLLTVGNLDQATTLAIADQLASRFDPQIDPQQLQLMQRALPAGLWQQSIPIDHNDAALFWYVQGQPTDGRSAAAFEQEALMRLVQQLQSAEFFHQLRTEQQLGYAVFTGVFPLKNTAGLFYFIQSPVAQPSALAAAIADFIESDRQRLAALPSERFEAQKNSLIQQLRQADTRLSDRSARWWNLLSEYGADIQPDDFERRAQLADRIEQISHAELLAFYDQLLAQELGQMLLSSPTDQPLPGANAQPSDWPLIEFD
ncbi:insulinase family protein [Marinospirillum sp. MEB164]|uniref:Protease 3 n=1 Tax=Marinospirillum alkalitolerans TaxID=3123374 RepID=A0ABW8PUR6_9GAMM